MTIMVQKSPNPDGTDVTISVGDMSTLEAVHDFMHSALPRSNVRTRLGKGLGVIVASKAIQPRCEELISQLREALGLMGEALGPPYEVESPAEPGAAPEPLDLSGLDRADLLDLFITGTEDEMRLGIRALL